MRYNLDQGVVTHRESAQKLLIMGLPVILALALVFAGPEPANKPGGSAGPRRTPIHVYTVNSPAAIRDQLASQGFSAANNPAQPSQTSPTSSNAPASTTPAAPTSSPSVGDTGGSSTPPGSQPGSSTGGSSGSGSGGSSGPLSLTYSITVPAQTLPSSSTPLIKTSDTSISVN